MSGAPRRTARPVRLAALIVAATLTGLLTVPSVSQADTRDDKNAVDAQVAATQDELEGVSADLADAYLALQATQAQLPAAQSALDQAVAASAAADAHNADLAGQLAVAQADESRAGDQLAATSAQVLATQRSLDAFASQMYAAGSSSQLSVALGATSAQDFASRVVLADQVSAMTNQAITDLSTQRADEQAQQAYLTAVRAKVADLKVAAQGAADAARAAKDQAAAAKAALDALAAQQQAQAAALESHKAEVEAQLAQEQQEQADLQTQLVAQAQAAQALEAARIAAGGRAVTGGNGFLSMPAVGPITSPFGQRYHPILHVWKLHSGTDFGVACGTQVRAAADGTVISAGPGGGDGNRIVVDNGIVNGVDLVTTYNHLSRFVVTSGHVTRGQVIAISGNTGYSTGCHLHFETLENGQFVNPMKWL